MPSNAEGHLSNLVQGPWWPNLAFRAACLSGVSVPVQSSVCFFHDVPYPLVI